VHDFGKVAAWHRAVFSAGAERVEEIWITATTKLDGGARCRRSEHKLCCEELNACGWGSTFLIGSRSNCILVIGGFAAEITRNRVSNCATGFTGRRRLFREQFCFQLPNRF
jgi:hypothetical protein